MTFNFIIKLRRFFDTLFQSYQSQCACVFNDYSIKRYGKLLDLNTQYYFPSGINAWISLNYLIQFNRAVMSSKIIKKIIHNESLRTDISRMSSPCIDGSILSQFFVYITNKYNFRQICFKIEQTMIYRYFQSARVNYLEKDPLISRDQVLGIDISIHGRIPREPVRPRKTLQHKMLGKRSIRFVNRNIFLTNTALGVNPELGTFSIWIRIIILCPEPPPL